jgi:carboxyl-terminal processing protease
VICGFKKLSIRHLFLFGLNLLILPLLLFSCGSKNEKLESFQNANDFNASITIPVTEDCSNECIARKKEFRYLVYVGEKIYCYWDEKQTQYRVDFKQKATEFETRINDKMTDTNYYLLLAQWASLFRDGHVNPILKTDLTNFEFYNPTLRFEILAPGTNHESLIVSQVAAEVTQLKVGTLISKIQGKPWQTYMPEAEKYSMGSTPYMRKRQMANLIFRILLNQEGPKPISIEGEYLGKNVQETVVRNLNLYDGASSDQGNDDTGLKLLKSSVLENNIGYLRIDGFSGTKMAQLLEQAMDRLQNTDGLLIDLRRNGGGDQSGNVILKHLTEAPLTRYFQRALKSDYLIALRPEVLIDFEYLSGKFTELSGRLVNSAAPSEVYKRPVAVLTSSHCFSSCDTFVSALKQNGLATVLGENTGGGTGSPVSIDLPVSQHKFRYSVYQGFTAVSKTLLEGVGTAPDVVIEPTAQERAEKKDRQLERAVVWLSKKVAKTGAPENTFGIPQSLLDVQLQQKINTPLEIEFDQQVKQSFD